MATTYRHTQLSRPTVVVLGGIWLTALGWAVRAPHRPALTVTVFVGALLLLFPSLTVAVRAQAIEVFFGLGLIRRRIPLGRIRDARAVRNPWYYGWGIRLTPHGWLWNVYGRSAVEIQFDDGHRFRIGTDEPEKLVQALASTRSSNA